jgi:formylmethanofuran dehydrogenase subunit B
LPSTCLGCGCACDDIELRIDANRIIEARNACELGVRWFGDGTVPARALVGPRHASVDEAVGTAAKLLVAASRPLVFLAPDISCEAQRAAIAVADALQATVDSVTSLTAAPGILAAQERGRASATLGEIRNRADIVVFWGVDPTVRYPRFWDRYAPGPAGTHVGSRGDRTVIAVNVGRARGPGDADQRFAVPPDREVELLAELTARATGSAGQDAVPELLQTMLRGRYVALISDGEPDDRETRDAGRSAALIALAQALNGQTRCAQVVLRAGGNRSGADSCLTSQTGYPMAVDFSRSFPRYRPHEHAAARLTRGTVDAVLVVGSIVLVPELHTRVAGVPTVLIGPRATEAPFDVAAAVDTGVAGIHESGTALRMDDVPLPLEGVIPGPPAAVDVVAALRRRVAAAPVRADAASARAAIARGAGNRQ